MAQLLPLDQKPHIQHSYIRYRELLKDLKSAEKQNSFIAWVKWGGLTLLIASLFRPEWPLFVGGAGLVAFVVGWVMKSDARSRYTAHLQEEQEIRQRMKIIGVIFVPHGESVYAGEIATENLVSPLSDDSYR